MNSEKYEPSGMHLKVLVVFFFLVFDFVSLSTVYHQSNVLNMCVRVLVCVVTNLFSNSLVVVYALSSGTYMTKRLPVLPQTITVP